MPEPITTSYNMSKGVVQSVNFSAESGTCSATLNKDGDGYSYTSNLQGDDAPVASDRKLSLADCVLSAHVHLGLIPAQNFGSIDCHNQH